jgi:integrase
MWHRHPELLWELSALRQDWLFCFDPQAKGNQGLAWHQDFAAARERLRDWVTISGTRLDRDRPTRITVWPGGESEIWTEPDATEKPVTARTADSDYVMLAALLAARGSEVSGLEVGDADWENKIVTIRRQTFPGAGGLVTKQTKGREIRHVPVLQALVPVLERLTRAQVAKTSGDFHSPRADGDDRQLLIPYPSSLEKNSVSAATAGVTYSSLS